MKHQDNFDFYNDRYDPEPEDPYDREFFRESLMEDWSIRRREEQETNRTMEGLDESN